MPIKIPPGWADDATDDRDKRIAELEGDLTVARLMLMRIDELLVGSYGESRTMLVEDLRRIHASICYILKPHI